MKVLSKLILTALLVLLLSAAWAAPALADDGVPPPADSTEASVEREEPTPQEVVTEETPQPPVVETASDQGISEYDSVENESGNTTPSEVPSSGETVEQLMDLVPENTEIVLLDDNGEVVPLAEQAASEILATGDPIWCPAR